MRTRIAAAALAAAALLALTACSSSDNDDKATPTKTPSVDQSSIDAAAGIPPKPDAAHQAIYLAALKAVDPTLAADPEKAVREARNQCSTLNSGGDPTGHTAATRIGNDAHPLTDAQGMAINAALRASLCPKK
jgi:type IV secretory pathway VirB10-like protein